ncbi:MAG: phosphatase PAP2 family protein [Alphaproteobacteria bacterium]|nr:phosphatase PAP2 family protein [Alphaproteobacteria bacterium]
MFITHENKLNWKRILIGLLVTLGLVFGGIFYFDISVFNFLRRFDCVICEYIGAIFSAKVWLLVSFIALCIFYIRKFLRTKEKGFFSNVYGRIKNSYAFMVFASVFFASFVGIILKFVIGRARPVFYEALGMTGFYPFAQDWAFHSMPSGHTMASFAGLVMIGMLVPRAKWFTWTLAIVIGLSRICIGAHWPSDVILGAFVGMIAADVVRALISWRKE